uniref:Ubiquitin carboxyl-terminal hydrolase n=1 Tax=Astyanax mexicanus TaxID=7994 RepID=A0A3B1K5Z1_ASTMX
MLLISRLKSMCCFLTEMEDRSAAERLRLRWNERLPVGAGLWNLGNTCFLNSVLQCLTYTPPLANYILSGEHSNTCFSPESCITCSIQKHFTQVFANPGTVIIPVDMVSKLTLISEQFCLGQQEDAHEFFSYTVSALEQSCLNRNMLDRETEGTNLIKQIFEGCMRSRVKCLSCRAESDTFEPYMDVALDIREAEDLTDALRQFVRSEQLDGYKCNVCMKTSPASKTFAIFRSSNVLTICLKRFNFYGDKISKFVRYPTYLDMDPFMSDGGGSDERQTYKLYAVLVHSGSDCQIGHYYCYVKAGDSKWYKMDDSEVSVADKQSVLSEQAYMLFYIRTTKTKAMKRSNTCGESSGIENTKRKREHSQNPDKEESPPMAKRACKEIPATLQQRCQEENKQKIWTSETQNLERGSYRYGDGFDLGSIIFNTTQQSTEKRKRSPSSDKEESPPTAKQARKEMPATLQQSLQEENKPKIWTSETQNLERGSYRYGDGFDLGSIIFNTTQQSTEKRKRSPSSDKEESPPTAKQARKEMPATLQQSLQEENKPKIWTSETQNLERGSYRYGDGFDLGSIIFNTTQQSTEKRKRSPSSDKEESPPTAKQARKEMPATLQQSLQEENKPKIRTLEKHKLEERSDKDSLVYGECSGMFYTPQQSTVERKRSHSSDKDESPPRR